MVGGSASATDSPPHAMVALYRVAPGKHLNFMKWMAARKAIDKQAGVPAPHGYVHYSGVSWDHISVGPVTTPAYDIA